MKQSLEKYKLLTVKNLKTKSVIPTCADTRERFSRCELELSSQLKVYNDPPPIPARPDVLDGELFPPCLGMEMEDLLNPGSKKLLDQLDNPDKFLSRLPPLPLPEWSNIMKREGMLIEKMVSKEGHIVMPESVVNDINR